jgi:hypothetical protein
VDDCILARNNLSFFITTKGELSKEFGLTNNGPLGYCLGTQTCLLSL